MITYGFARDAVGTAGAAHVDDGCHLTHALLTHGLPKARLSSAGRWRVVKPPTLTPQIEDGPHNEESLSRATLTIHSKNRLRKRKCR